MNLIGLVIVSLMFVGAYIFIDSLGQKIFKVSKGDGFHLFGLILVWGAGPVVLLFFIFIGVIKDAAAIFVGLSFLPLLKFIWWDNFVKKKNKTICVEVKSDIPAVPAKQTPVTQVQTITQNQKEWVYTKNTGLLTNRRSGKTYDQSHIEFDYFDIHNIKGGRAMKVKSGLISFIVRDPDIE